MARFARFSSRPGRARLQLECLESRLNPSWTTAPLSIALPSATALTLGNQQSLSSSASISSTEIDYYSFTPAWSSPYTFTASRNGSQVDTVIGVYSSSGSRLAWNDDISNANTNSQVGVNLVAGQKYYLGVTNYTGTSGGNYTFGVKATLADDVRENNDTLATASNLGSLASTTTLSGLVMADGADFYRFTTSTPGGAVQIQFKNAQGDLDLSVLDSAGKVLMSSATTADGEKLNLTGLVAGTYVVRVTGKSGAYNPVYSLTLTPAASPPPVTLPPPTTPPPSAGKSDWTIAVYMTASDLASYGAADVNEMEAALAGLPGSVKITLLYDQWNSQKFATGGGSQAAWGDTGRAVLTPDTNLNVIKTQFEKLGEKNTGDPVTLTNFLTWTTTVAPANRYGLVMWNHGSGLDGSNYDDESNDNLQTQEIITGVKNSGIKLDLLCFDACLMGMTEVAWSLKDITPVLVVSQELVAGTGQDYTTTFAALKTNPGQVDGFGLGKGMVASWTKQYVGKGTNEDTLSVLRTDQLGKLISALASFSSTITTSDLTAFRSVASKTTSYGDGDFPAYRDLGQLMRGLSTATGVSTGLRSAASAVVSALDAAVYARTADGRGSSGLSIYAPLSSSERDVAFADYSTYLGTSNWNRVLGLLGA